VALIRPSVVYMSIPSKKLCARSLRSPRASFTSSAVWSGSGYRFSTQPIVLPSIRSIRGSTVGVLPPSQVDELLPARVSARR
jgi:hypothetical protein